MRLGGCNGAQGHIQGSRETFLGQKIELCDFFALRIVQVMAMINRFAVVLFCDAPECRIREKFKFGIFVTRVLWQLRLGSLRG